MQAETVDLNRLSDWSSRLITLLLAVVLVWVLGNMIWQMIGAERPELNTGTTASVGEQAAAPGDLNLSSLHLFGRSEAALSRGAGGTVQSSSAVTLVGTLTGKQSPIARAFVALDNGEQRAFRLDDAIPGAGRLTQIHADHIVVSDNGIPAQIQLTKPVSAAARVAPRVGGPSRARRNSGSLPGIRPDRTQSTDSKPIFDGSPLELARDIKAVPYTENGRQIGVRLQAGQYANTLSRLGLHSTDVITSVNGVNLDDPARSLQALQSMAGSRQFSVSVQRNGRPVTLNIDLDET